MIKYNHEHRCVKIVLNKKQTIRLKDHR